ncbi:activating signal cointegrator 1 complex subunit 2 isoform X2 [Sitodiplosis mosellana]|uniref:activating signal cointegrator 1 complex subunit 2 isoform X2 n=1 Tax=Sitodiplosis mosellana TaxID=263140 RepID=UPI002444CE6F|nr:activating signal cointegrator 1 complex subunit 2 isoform X2 [Sitodiplosis mosellana]
MPFDIDFENPQKLALPDLQFHVKDNGVKLVVPALGKKWVDEQRHIKYLPLKSKCMDEEFMDKWIKIAKWLNNTLESLLEMEHYRFWSNLVFEPDYIATIVSFLQEAVPAYIPITSLTTNQQIIDLYTNIANNTLIVLCRMITNKESETEWMTKEQLADILYDKYLITVPMIFDLLVVYGTENTQIVRRLLETVLKIQPKYRNDLKEGLNFLATTFNTIQEKVNENNPDNYEDLVMYILDCTYTIHTFIVILPDAVDICREVQLEQKVTRFYDEAIPFLHKNITYINPALLTELNRSRLLLIKFFRSFVDKCLQAVLQEHAKIKKQSAADELVNMLQMALADPNFVSDYQRLHPVADDVDILIQSVPKIDKMKIDFVVQGYTSVKAAVIKSEKDAAAVVGGASSSYGVAGSSSASGSSSSKSVGPSKIDIQNVLDVLPHLEVPFVRKLLSRYDNTESAIAAVFEGNLPPDLDDTIHLDSPTTEKKVDEPIKQVTELMENHKLGTTVREIVKIKSQVVWPKAEKRFLDDKSAIKEFHARNIEHGYVDMPDEYDDEYDDSYDAMVESESKTMKILKNTGAINELVDEVEDSEESESDDKKMVSGEQRDKSRDFCENPEAARERWARNREAKYGNKRAPPSRPQGNVVGNPKGQGQDKSTLVNRQRKNENKSSRANHNRRQGAAFKRNRGMIPS